MEKITFSYSQSQDAWRTKDPNTIPNYFECYRASEVDAERAALLAAVRVLVDASNAIYNDACINKQKAPSVLYDNLKQAIAAAKEEKS